MTEQNNADVLSEIAESLALIRNVLDTANQIEAAKFILENRHHYTFDELNRARSIIEMEIQ